MDVASLYTKWRTHTTFRPASTLAMRARCAPQALLWPSPQTGVDFVVVCFECRLVAWECCYLKLVVASLRFGFDGVRSRYSCCSPCFCCCFAEVFPVLYFLVCPVRSLVVCRLHHRLPLVRFWFLFQLHPPTVLLLHPPIRNSFLL